MLTNTEDWLYDDGEDAALSVYEQRLEELKKIGDPIAERVREHDERGSAFEDFDRSIMRARKVHDAYISGSEDLKHIGNDEMAKVLEVVNEKKQWLDENRDRQAKRHKAEPPVIFVYQINSELSLFEKSVLPIINKQKPKPPTSKTEEKPQADRTAGGAGDTSAEQPSKPEATANTSPEEMDVD